MIYEHYRRFVHRLIIKIPLHKYIHYKKIALQYEMRQKLWWLGLVILLAQLINANMKKKIKQGFIQAFENKHKRVGALQNLHILNLVVLQRYSAQSVNCCIDIAKISYYHWHL